MNARRTAATGGTARRRDPLALRLPAWRSRLMLGMLFLAFASLSVRALILQGGGWWTRFLIHKGEEVYARNLPEPAVRGAILDRNGVVIASSVPMREIAVRTGDFEDTPANLARLAAGIGMNAGELHRRVDGVERASVTLAHGIDPVRAQGIELLAIPGVYTVGEYQRQYPEGPVTSHLAGFTGSGERGIEGIEREFDDTLQGRPGMRHVIEDRMGRVVDSYWVRPPVQGRDLTLAIDDRIQYLAHAAVRRAAEANSARAAAAVVLDARTGELLALANWPGFDPAHRTALSQDRVRDRAVTDTFEPGSTLKPFSIATAIEAGLVTPWTVIDTSPGRIVVDGRTISDEHPHGVLTVEQVLAKSSNVGTTRIALGLPAQALWDTLAGVGFGQPPHAGLSGEVAGRLRPAASWKPVEQATIAYGYGVSVSLLQLAHAYLAFARDGDIVPVSVLRRTEPPQGVRVFRPETVQKMRRMLELATSDEGTAPAARIPGYRVAGKTSTARKLRDGRYTDAHIAAFAGFAPASDPRIVVAVMVDEPSGTHYHGGDVAAPVFAAIASGTLRALQVAPDDATIRLAADGGRDG
jgi:cell division protein FtsI (penicillin-binding protein 3)